MSVKTSIQRFFGYDPGVVPPGYADDHVPVTGGRSIRPLDCGHTSNRFAIDRDDRAVCLDCYAQEMTSL